MYTVNIRYPLQLVQAKFWQINDMADYIDLLRDVSYHLSYKLYVPRLRETACEYFFTLPSDSSFCIWKSTSGSLSSQF